MHIVFVTPELNNNNGLQGGLGTFVANIARIFAEKGHDVEIVLVTTKPESKEFEKNIILHNIYVSKQMWEEIDSLSKCVLNNELSSKELRIEILNIYKSEKVKKLIDEISSHNRIDVIHFANHGAFSRFIGKDIPYVIRISGFLNIWKGGGNEPNGSVKYMDNPLLFSDIFELKEIEKCKNIMVPSMLLSSILQNELKIESSVIESPFLLSREKWNYEILESQLTDKKFILFYGTCSYLKGIHVIAGIVKLFLEQNPEHYLVICGRDVELTVDHSMKIKASDYVKRAAGEYSSRVIYPGLLLRNQLYPIIERAELCIMPSRIENLSNACIESMALGKIIVATDGASYEQLIEDGLNGFLCERDNPDSFLKAINTVLHMKENQKHQIEENAVKTVDRLSPEIIYEKYHQYYLKVIASFHEAITRGNDKGINEKYN